jgi:hypothetical protein
MALAKANNTPVASMPAELAANTMTLAATVNEPRIMAMRQAPLKAHQPTEEEADISEVFVVRASPIDRTQLPAELAKTGSPLPLIGLVGLFSIGAALGMRFAAARKDF